MGKAIVVSEGSGVGVVPEAAGDFVLGGLGLEVLEPGYAVGKVVFVNGSVFADDYCATGFYEFFVEGCKCCGILGGHFWSVGCGSLGGACETVGCVKVH